MYETTLAIWKNKQSVDHDKNPSCDATKREKIPRRYEKSKSRQNATRYIVHLRIYTSRMHLLPAMHKKPLSSSPSVNSYLEIYERFENFKSSILLNISQPPPPTPKGLE